MKSKFIVFGLGFISTNLLGLLFALFTIGKRPAASSTTSNTMKYKEYDYEFDGFVPNEETAIRIAVAIWLTFHGEGINDLKPYRVELKDNTIWVVKATFQQPTLGSAPYIEIQKSDSKILKISF